MYCHTDISILFKVLNYLDRYDMIVGLTFVADKAKEKNGNNG